MIKSFLPNPNSQATIPTPSASTNDSAGANKMMLVGAPDWIKGKIHQLHVLGFAEAGHWSRLLPTGNPGEMISILMQSKIRH